MNPDTLLLSKQAERDRFEQLRSLADDWDGQGAIAPAPATIAYADRLTSELRSRGWPAFDRAYALNSGEVVLEWSAGDSHFEIEVAAPDQITWMRTRLDEQTKHGSGWSMEAANELATTLIQDTTSISNDDGARFEMVGKAIVTEMLVDELGKSKGEADTAIPRHSSFKIDMSKLLENEIRRLEAEQRFNKTKIG